MRWLVGQVQAMAPAGDLDDVEMLEELVGNTGEDQ